MSSAMELRSGSASPARIGQATAVEQSRAIAEVQAQVVVAQQMPRDIERAVREMKRSCSRMALAEKAFYRFPRGSKQVTGETITLAKELARCWGNLDYGLAELRRDDFAGESEMMAFAWDLETNTRPRTTFIVPHVRDKRDGGARLTESRDVYENNASNGNRRMREMIFNILPPWFIEDAKSLCYATLAGGDGDGRTLAERSATAVTRFAAIGVRPEQLTQKLGAPQAAWSAPDLATLAVIIRSIERGESSKEDEFGATTAATIAPADLAPADKPAPKRQRRTEDPSPAGVQSVPAPASPASPAPGPAGEALPPLPEAEITAPVPGGDAREAEASKAGSPGPGRPEGVPGDERHKKLVGVVQGQFKRLGYTDEEKAQRLIAAAELAGVGDIASLNDLTHDELAQVADRLGKCRDRSSLTARLMASDSAGA